MLSLILALALFGGPPAADGLATVPGAVNSQITQANMSQTICNPKWSTKAIRPPSSYTNKLKVKQMAQLGLTGKPSDYEEDHLISLEIGGSPTDPNNLWPQKWAGQWGAHIKDRLENRLHKLVCSGSITLSDAQHAISTDWVAAYRKYVGPL